MTGISGRRRLIFAAAAAVLSLSMSACVLLGADLYAHSRAERTAGLNVWGYRGPIAGRKAPGEVRLAFLGGSTMFGYGVRADEAIPAVVERELRAALAGDPPASAVNLGYNNEGAYSFAFTLTDFAYLDYDVVVLYEGYNDLMGDPQAPNTAVFRHQSAVFRLTGYYPILPLVLREKAMALRFGSLESGYEHARGGKTVFTPSLAQRTSAAVLQSASGVTEALGRQLERFSETPRHRIVPTTAGCAYPWAEYCESIHVAVSQARAAGYRVVVVTQPRPLPPLADVHRAQQDAMHRMLRAHFADDDAVVLVDLSESVDLSDPELSYDAMHLTAAGNRQVGAALAQALIPVVRAVRAPRG